MTGDRAVSPRRRAGRHPGRWGRSQRVIGRGAGSGCRFSSTASIPAVDPKRPALGAVNAVMVEPAGEPVQRVRPAHQSGPAGAAFTYRPITCTEEEPEVAAHACPEARYRHGQHHFGCISMTPGQRPGAPAAARGRPTPRTAGGALGHPRGCPEGGAARALRAGPCPPGPHSRLVRSPRSPAGTSSCYRVFRPPPISSAAC